MIETIPGLHRTDDTKVGTTSIPWRTSFAMVLQILWMVLEYFFVVNFTLELLGELPSRGPSLPHAAAPLISWCPAAVRFLCAPSWSDFTSDGFNHIDFVSVVPFYIELLLRDLKVDLRMLRILRLGRALRLVSAMPSSMQSASLLPVQGSSPHDAGRGRRCKMHGKRPSSCMHLFACPAR